MKLAPYGTEKDIWKSPKKAVDSFEKNSGERFEDIIKEGVKRFGTEEKFKNFLHEFCQILTKKRVKKAYTQDILISHMINSLDEVDKIINTFLERIREIYGIYRPEFSKKTVDINKIINEIENDEKGDKEEMGQPLEEKEFLLLNEYAKTVKKIIGLRSSIEKRIEKTMEIHAKNVSAVAGPLLGAKLISIAGSLENMTRMPSSTIQVLGAEKALFRHLKKGTRPPKHGVIIQHPLIAKAKPKAKGRMARALAGKISIASKVDFYKGEFIGKKLLEAIKK